MFLVDLCNSQLYLSDQSMPVIPADPGFENVSFISAWLILKILATPGDCEEYAKINYVICSA
jgi:hypothetical protein